MAKGTQRRLTTIVAADIAGFSRLVGADEESTLAAQRAHRTELIEPLLAEHNGRIANTAGDSFLFEFPSAVEAVRCSIAVQDGIAGRNRDIAADQRIEYRIGINVGDVMADGDDLLGDGVNIAARLENLCTPGGIILSDDAYRQVRDRLDVSWEDGGEHEVKNIARPVSVWRWSAAVAPTVALTAEDTPLPLPDKPSIAVLPFDNMSSDPEHEYFADGIAEDIITALSKISRMRVIARNSTFAYKGRAVDLRQVANELGVHYVLEGSIRSGGNRLRITAQLIDATDGSHVWAERFDRTIDDIFDIQDEITKEIVSALRVQLTDGEVASVLNRETDSINAWKLCVEATEQMLRYDVPSGRRARELAQQALKIDQNYAHANAVIAFSYWVEARQGLTSDNSQLYDKAYEFGRRANDINANSPWAYSSKALAAAGLGKMDEAIKTIEDALSIIPGNAELIAAYALIAMKGGDFSEAVTSLEAAMHLNPFPPAYYYSTLSRAYEGNGQMELAYSVCQDGLCKYPDFFALIMSKVSLLARDGKQDEAKSSLGQFRDIAPHFKNRFTGKYLFIDDDAFCARYVEGLKIAGLPD